MRCTIIAALIILTSSVRAQPSTDQTDWSSGIVFFPDDYGFGTGFIQQNGTEWLSEGRLSLEFPLEYELIAYQIANGWDVVAGDFDNDGFPDLACSEQQPVPSISILHNPGAGGEGIWLKTAVYSGAGSIRTLAAGDIDGDDDQDLVASKGNAFPFTLFWLENPGGSGSWEYHHIAETTVLAHIDCGDPDSDGDTDIAAAYSMDDRISVFINNGGGVSWLEETVTDSSDGPYQVLFDDIDNNGVQDLLAVLRTSDRISWFHRDQSSCSWTEHTVTEFYHPYAVSTGDYDGNGTLDILAVGYDEGQAYLCYSPDGTGESWVSYQLLEESEGALTCAFADFCGDGFPDPVVTQYSEKLLIVLSNDATMPWDWFSTVLNTDKAVSVAVLDSDLDGRQEVAVLFGNSLRLASVRPDTFCLEGSLNSQIAPIPEGCDYVDWGEIYWNAVTPEGTSISFQVRASQDPYDMGAWSDPITESGTCLDGILPLDPYYMQYRVNLQSSSSSVSPLLFSMGIQGWWPGETEEENRASVSTDIIAVAANPCRGPALVTVSPGSLENGVLAVYDTSGRVVFSEGVPSGGGSIMVNIPPLPAGVYTLAYRSSSLDAVERLCVIR